MVLPESKIVSLRFNQYCYMQLIPQTDTYKQVVLLVPLYLEWLIANSQVANSPSDCLWHWYSSICTGNQFRNHNYSEICSLWHCMLSSISIFHSVHQYSRYYKNNNKINISTVILKLAVHYRPSSEQDYGVIWSVIFACLHFAYPGQGKKCFN